MQVRKPNEPSLRTTTARAALLALLLSTTALTKPSHAWTLETTSARESISNGTPDWTENVVLAWHKPSKAWTFGGTYRQAERLSTSNSDLTLNMAHEFSPGWTLEAQTGVGIKSTFLPRRQAVAVLSHVLGDGYVVSGGMTHRAYQSTNLSAFQFGLDKYIGDSRISLGYVHARSAFGVIGNAMRLLADWDVGRGFYVGALLAGGYELDVTVPPYQVYQVRAYALTARMPLVDGWTVLGEVGTTKQGNAYERRGFRIGLRHAF